ncbi:hypothetical protein FZEAL_9976 [Fusarium zealandicum]|uniref:F-box domain-containing protein n=1 Tax=Fusarium zealandicum TaxID=1053134 RepID=A0A8H4XD54_9HYPO|nr:hypothetical protein FZEAL_9976 [Fusarium zealandicum]
MRRRRDTRAYSPPGQGTRPTERWTLLVPNKEQQMRLPSLEDTNCWPLTPPSFCTCHLSFDAFKLLCGSIENINTNKHSRGVAQITPQQTPSHTRLEELVPELLGIIFTFLDPDDFISLGLCSQTLWAQAIGWAQNGYLRWRSAYSWAGTPVICVGSELQALPQSIYDMFPSAIPEAIPDKLDSGEHGQMLSQNRPGVWHNEAIERYEKTPVPFDDLYLDGFWKHIRSAGIPPELQESMAATFPTFSIEPGSKWYLRNLTQNEYIRMEAIITSDGEVTISFLGNHWLTLDIILLWLISWRGDDARDTYSWEQLEQFVGVTDTGLGDTMIDPTYGPLDHTFWPIWAGPWAGHRLDVVADEVGVGWVDRTGMIESLSGKWMRTLYGNALYDRDGVEQYWAEVFEQSGGAVNLNLREYGSDSYGSHSD